MSNLPPPILGFFDDADPEDAWAASDSTDEQMRVIVLCMRFIVNHPELEEGERLRRLRSVEDSIDFVATRLSRAMHELRGDN